MKKSEFLNNPLLPVASSAICLENLSDCETGLLPMHVKQLNNWGVIKK